MLLKYARNLANSIFIFIVLRWNNICFVRFFFIIALRKKGKFQIVVIETLTLRCVCVCLLPSCVSTSALVLLKNYRAASVYCMYELYMNEPCVFEHTMSGELRKAFMFSFACCCCCSKVK